MTPQPLEEDVITCADVADRELLERSAAGDLTAPERALLEAHV